MDTFLAIALSFPAVVYTVLLGVSLVYWVFVMVGAAHVNFLGDGAVDAAADAVFEGAFEGASESLGGGSSEAGSIGDASGGTTTGLISSLALRSAPATIVLSVLFLFTWILTMLGMRLMQTTLPDTGIFVSVAKVALLIAAPILSLFPTSFAIRPLARIFTPVKATTHNALVGKLCTIRTGTVTDRFGEATLEDGGAGVVVRVRVEASEKLGRGDLAVIVGYDAEREEFTVVPMEGILEKNSRGGEPG